MSAPATAGGARLSGLPRTAVRRVRSMPLPLAALLVVALLHGLAWTLVTAPLNGPDEANHVAYTQHLAETGDGPKQLQGTSTYSTEESRLIYELNLGPILGHLDARPSWNRTAALDNELGKLPKSARTNGDGPNPLGNNPPLYYAYTAIAYRLSPDQSALGRLYAMRIATVLLFLVTVGLVWLLAGELFRRPWQQVLATGLVALQPKLGFIAGIVNTDMMLIAISTGLLLASVRLVRNGPTPGRVAVVGLLGGMGPLTHGRGFALLPLALLALLIAAVRFWPGIRSALRLAAFALVPMLTAALTGYLWTKAHAAGAFGGELSRQSAQGFSARQFLSYLWQFYFRKMDFMDPTISPPYGYRQAFIQTYYGTFGSLEVEFSPRINDWLQIGSTLGLVGLFAVAMRRAELLRREWPVVLLAVGMFVSMMALLHLTAYRILLAGSPDPLVTGRYILSSVALWAIAITWVVGALPRSWGRIASGLLLAISVCLALGGLGLSAERFLA